MTRTSTTSHSVGAATARPSTATDLPCLVGAWQLIRLAAVGHVCHVYQARPAGRDLAAPASYAVKLLASGHQDDAAALDQLQREAWLGRKLPHPHLVSVLDSHVTEPPHFIVMPWLRGATLAQRLASGWRPELPVALWIVRQVAEALDELHRHGWLHADVKPSNIFVSPDGHTTLLDLGFACRASEMTSAVLRQVRGTVAYIAPEMLTSSLRPDIRSDLYSLGVTLFEMLSGRLPFDACDLAELAHDHLCRDPADIRTFVPGLPLSVARLVRCLLAREPLRRPHSPRELIERVIPLEVDAFAERLFESE